MKKTIYTKNYKIKFIRNWFVCNNGEVKIIITTQTRGKKHEGFNKEYFINVSVREYLLNTLNGCVRYYGYEEIPSEVSKERANMLRIEWIKIRKEFEGCKK